MYKLHGKRYAYRFNIEEIKGTNLNQSELSIQSEVDILHCKIYSQSKTNFNSAKEKKKDEGLMELAN